MNEETVKLIDKLASKLGTTSEYLWTVLLKQAPIDAIYHLIGFVLTAIIIRALFSIHKRLLKKDNDFSYYRSEGAVAFTVVSGCICVLFLFIQMVNIDHIFTGFFNPEFWALNHIIDKLK